MTKPKTVFDFEFDKLKNACEIGSLSPARALDMMKEAIDAQIKATEEAETVARAAIEILENRIKELESQLKEAVETKAEEIVEYYNQTDSDGEFTPPNPIFSMAEHIDWLKAKLSSILFVAKNSDIKVFKMSEDDWMIGKDLQSCIDTYISDYADFDSLEEPCELDLSDLVLLEYRTEEGGKILFCEALKKEVESGGDYPRLFATVES